MGYDLYCKMLNEAVKERKGLPVQESFETAIDLTMDAFVPDRYITDEFRKLDVYKRIAQIRGQADREEMEDELMDRFGDLPRPVETLLWAAQVKAAAHDVYISKISARGNKFHMEVFEHAKIDPGKLMAFLQRYPNQLYFVPKPEPAFDYVIDPKAKTLDLLKDLYRLCLELLEICEN